MKVLPQITSLCLLAMILAACLPQATALPPLPTDTPLPSTLTPTATIVWFPPTPTYTPYPSAAPVITATQDVRPVFGELLFSDDFTDPQPWSLGAQPAGSVAFGKRELTLAVSQEKGYLSSLRQGSLGDFYAEITASPSLCRGQDEYGLLVHAASPKDFFRFSASCNGQVRVDRLLKGLPSSPYPWTLSGAIPPGAPSTSRLAIWVSGREMRFFANDQLVCTVMDASIPSGAFGVFARAAADTAVTVNFSDLRVYHLAP